LRGRHHRPPRSLEPPGSTDPGRVTFRHALGDPGPAPVTHSSTDSVEARAVLSRPRAPWRTTIMAAKPKPQPTDEAREQARRALQTSLDTRQ